jgi:drug/metabolite transporter (DMT)-like permease
MADAPVLTPALGQQLAAAAWLVLPAAVALPRASFEVGALGALVALALLCTAVAYLVSFWLIERVGAVRTSTVTYIIPVFGVLWGALFLSEPLTPALLAGLGCILMSLALVNRGRTVTPAIRQPAGLALDSAGAPMARPGPWRSTRSPQ